MIEPEVQQLAKQLQAKLGITIPCGQVVLNFNENLLQSVETKTFMRVAAKKTVDKGANSSHP